MVDQVLVKEVLRSRWHATEGWSYCWIKSEEGSPFIRMASDALEIAQAIVKDHNEKLGGMNCKLLVEIRRAT